MGLRHDFHDYDTMVVERSKTCLKNIHMVFFLDGLSAPQLKRSRNIDGMGGFMDNSTHFSGWIGVMGYRGPAFLTKNPAMFQWIYVQKLDKSPGELPKKNHI